MSTYRRATRDRKVHPNRHGAMNGPATASSAEYQELQDAAHVLSKHARLRGFAGLGPLPHSGQRMAPPPPPMPTTSTVPAPPPPPPMPTTSTEPAPLHRHHWCSLRRPTTSRSTPRLSGAAQMNNGAASVASGSLLDGSLPDEHSEPKIDPGNGGTSAPNAGHLRLETPTGIGAKEKLAGDKSIKPRSIDDEEAYPPLAHPTPSGLFL